MNRLLVPFDGSGGAQRALRHAIALAKAAGNTSLHLLHVHEEPRIYGEIAVYVPARKMKALQRRHCEAILAQAERAVRRAGVAYAAEALTGPVAPTIARRARRLGCAAIVMGTKGMTAIGNLVMGSIATKVVHLSRIPVTLVR
jgi:nucleotide-binding universal stress UspA family protein